MKDHNLRDETIWFGYPRYISGRTVEPTGSNWTRDIIFPKSEWKATLVLEIKMYKCLYSHKK